jgi:hypothetical protein
MAPTPDLSMLGLPMISCPSGVQEKVVDKATIQLVKVELYQLSSSDM